jgi:branched-subunit amino acid transport protein
MTAVLVVVLGIITYASRAAALVLLPNPGSTLARVLERIPAPLFASLAVLAVIQPDGSAAPAPVLAASVAALLTVPRRSLPLTLAAGLAGYALGARWL